MKIELKHIKIRDLVKNYVDSAESGVSAYGGKLDIRPPYQREFVYKEKQRNAVIETVMKQFPLNIMYWVKREDGTFEVLDGQQRTISICQFVHGDFSLNYQYFHNLSDEEKEQFLNYELTVYQCEGTDSEKLEWFKIVNMAGVELTAQELRNAVYAGPWLTDAKRRFSKSGCMASVIAKGYLTGSPIRQDFLETALKWIYPTEEDRSGKVHQNLENYMALHQFDQDAKPLWNYFHAVMNWTKMVFPVYRNEMKGLDWGLLYNQFKDQDLDPEALEQEIEMLMEDEEIDKKDGIYAYVLTREEKHLNFRSFSKKDKSTMYHRQKGHCKRCRRKFEIDKMEADHITPWSEGGKTHLENGQMLCKKCNREKSNR